MQNKNQYKKTNEVDTKEKGGKDKNETKCRR